MPPPLDHLSEKIKPCPGYFIVRPTGEVVPLIPVDELPLGTNLEGLPRSLDLEDTFGMLNLGIQRSSGAIYRIAQPNEKKEPSGLAIRTKHQSNKLTATQATSPRSQVNPTVSPSPTPSNGSLGPPLQPRADTQICRHWCTHGICKWGQHCRYRHIMPMTLPGLQEIGLEDWPAWYRALNPGYFSNTSGPNRRTRPRPSFCAGNAGNACCGGAGTNGVQGRGQSRLGGPHGRLRRENTELGEQILEKLRALPKVGKRGAGKGGEPMEKPAGQEVMLERAAMKEKRDWEEESDNDTEVEEKKKTKGVAKEKLVDV